MRARRLRSLSRPLVLGATVAAGALCPGVAAAAAAPLNWSSPKRIVDQKPFSNFNGGAVSCPSSALCVMGDPNGELEALTGPGAKGQTRAVLAIPGASSIDQVECPATTLCVAADSGGDVITSANPTGGAGAWRVKHLGNEFMFSCPASTECVGVDDGGNIATSTDPSAASHAWTLTSGPQLARISCPTTTLCFAIDAIGNLWSSTDPAAGGAGWRQTGAGLGPLYTALSCPTATLCVASGLDGTVARSSTPSGGTAWKTADVDGDHWMFSISCSTASLCVAGDNAGNVVVSTRPDSDSWTVADIDGTDDISAVSCPATSFCAAADGGSDALLSAAPTAGTAGWAKVHYGGYDPLVSIACPSTSSCVAVDGAGDHVASSSSPASGVWKVVSPTGGLPAAPQIWQVTCTTKSSCLALVTSGRQPGFSDADGSLYSFDPVGGAHGFNRIGVRGVGVGGLIEVSCPTRGLCAARDASGDVFTSRRPTKASAWDKIKVTSRTPRLFAISCPTRSLCVSLHPDPATRALPTGSLYISGGGLNGPFKTVGIDGNNGLTGVSCPSFSPCVAVDDSGNALIGAHPLRGGWRPTHIDSWPLTSVACPSKSLCVAVDAGGRAVVGAPTKSN